MVDFEKRFGAAAKMLMRAADRCWQPACDIYRAKECWVVKFDLAGKMLTTFGTGGKFPGGLAAPHDFSVDPEGNLYVANPWNFTVDKYVPRKGADPKRVIGQRYRAGT